MARDGRNPRWRLWRRRRQPILCHPAGRLRYLKVFLFTKLACNFIISASLPPSPSLLFSLSLSLSLSLLVVRSLAASERTMRFRDNKRVCASLETKKKKHAMLLWQSSSTSVKGKRQYDGKIVCNAKLGGKKKKKKRQ